ncbi:MAG: hypothetical protein H5U13_10855 [Parvibaculum sp.]|nr:hypothetical protein [Parvibaculum sp.]
MGKLKKWQIYALAAAVAVVALAGTGYALRKDIILYALVKRARDATPVAPNRDAARHDADTGPLLQ